MPVQVLVHIVGGGTMTSKPVYWIRKGHKPTSWIQCQARAPGSSPAGTLQFTADCDGTVPSGLLLYPKAKPGFRFSHWEQFGGGFRGCTGPRVPCKVDATPRFWELAFFTRK